MEAVKTVVDIRAGAVDRLAKLAAPDMAGVDALIADRMHSPVSVIPALADHLINAGGKRLRPLITVASARLAGPRGDAHLKLAAAVEFIHTATLLHDDVVDTSNLRRGKVAAHLIWGAPSSVLVGDFLFARAFELMVETGSMRAMEILSRASRVIAEGEVLQLMNARDPDTTEERYLEVIHRKTARLFQAGAEVAAVVSGAPPGVQQALARFGNHLGTAYQLVDDVLDYQSDPDERGKNLGDDLAEGKPTLPLIHALRTGNSSTASLIRAAIRGDGRAQLDAIVDAIESTGSLQYTARLARTEADQALAALTAVPDSAFRTGLTALARFAIERRH